MTTMGLAVKICGITTPEALQAAVIGGARFVGMVFYPRSPRAVTPAVAAELARHVPTCTHVVGLFVNPSDDDLDHTLAQVPLDVMQLHGDETPARVGAIRDRHRIPIMKAFRVGSAADLDAVPSFNDVCDRFLFDARPPKNIATLPGGTGFSFDWSLLQDRRWHRPWMLAGGLTADNLETAVAATGARAVDVSSGVEDRPGHKPPALIRHFLARAAQI